MQITNMICQRCKKPLIGKFSKTKQFCWDCGTGANQKRNNERQKAKRRAMKKLVTVLE